ncbi:hypothetical protein EDD21DRAFT_74345 [Dissophora ornata]|nr:hypothetical protein EDD21DRAFT_74345 [Dissophora ornata]
MLRNTMTNNPLALFCVIERESNPFSVKINPSDTVDDVKDAIKAKKANDLSDVDADRLTLWKVEMPLPSLEERKPIVLNEVDFAIELKDPTDDISDVFKEQPPKKTISIIVQRPAPTLAPSRSSRDLSSLMKACLHLLTFSLNSQSFRHTHPIHLHSPGPHRGRVEGYSRGCGPIPYDRQY